LYRAEEPNYVVRQNLPRIAWILDIIHDELQTFHPMNQSAALLLRLQVVSVPENLF
jgi:hypothetical protein